MITINYLSWFVSCWVVDVCLYCLVIVWLFCFDYGLVELWVLVFTLNFGLALLVVLWLMLVVWLSSGFPFSALMLGA